MKFKMMLYQLLSEKSTKQGSIYRCHVLMISTTYQNRVTTLANVIPLPWQLVFGNHRRALPLGLMSCISPTSHSLIGGGLAPSYDHEVNLRSLKCQYPVARPARAYFAAGTLKMCHGAKAINRSFA
jgi:hypothetical protein